MLQVGKGNAGKKSHVVLIVAEKSAGVLYCEKGRDVVRKNTYGSLGMYQVRGLGLPYSTKESVVVITEDSFLCANTGRQASHMLE